MKEESVEREPSWWWLSGQAIFHLMVQKSHRASSCMLPLLLSML